MSEKCSTDTLTCNNTLRVKLKNVSENASNTHDTNSVLIEDITQQVPQIIQLKTIERLSLCGNQLSSLPINCIEYLTNLTYLDLSDNQLTDLPDSLNSLKIIQQLRIDCNQFSYIPKVICELVSLKSLKAQKNRITKIPDKFRKLVNLEDLDLSSNMLKELPHACTSLNHLQSLDLADNQFQKIPVCIVKGMRELKILDFSRNLHAELNVEPHSTNLTAFYARENNMCPTFPKWVLYSRFCNLEEVSLDKTMFQKFDLLENPPNSSVRKLSAHQSNLTDTTVQRMVAGMTNLEEIIIGNEDHKSNGNTFWIIPFESLNQPTLLKKVNMRGTGISMVPKIISIFENLSAIDISFNTISWLPEEICSLKSLTSLLISNNCLALLPKNIGKLVSLKELKANHNQLCGVPDSIRLLSDLQYIDLYHNEFESMPEVIMELPNLRGLDLEQNFFSTDDLLIDRRIHYEILRTVLRDHWQDNGKILKGPRIQNTYSDISSSSSRSSTSSSLEYREHCSIISPGVSLNTINLTDERWDASEDSADEFDPNEPREPRKRSYPPFTFYQHQQRVYCPAESHETRVITRVTRMLRDRTLIWPSDYEDGQFDDL